MKFPAPARKPTNLMPPVHFVIRQQPRRRDRSTADAGLRCGPSPECPHSGQGTSAFALSQAAIARQFQTGPKPGVPADGDAARPRHPMSIPIDLSGKRALVTGVSRGIGAAVATMLARAGCDVAGCGRDPAEGAGARSFAAGVTAAGRRADYRAVDLAEPEAAREWAAAAAAALGGCDILVSNAGRNIFKGAAACTEADWNECLQLDLGAHWRVAQAVRPWLERAGPGVAILIGSNHSFRTLPGCFPYNVAKAGVAALVQSLALEWGPAIRTVGLAPGFIDTPGNDTWFASFPDPAAERRRTGQRHPVGRIGTPEEIGAVCAFLATPWAGFISGTTLLIDGGRSARLQDD